MPRKARQVSPTGYYHVVNRGNNKEMIFIRHGDKEFFRHLFAKEFRERGIRLAAYCLMDNHAHFLLGGELTDISDSISRIQTIYAMRYNEARERRGHVFQGRFRSECIDSQRYFLQVLRYIHNNPVKAGMCRECSEYAWHSFGEYLHSAGWSLPGQENLDRYFTTASLRQMVWEIFQTNLREFLHFHRQPETQVHLDMEEEMEAQKKQVAAAILESCQKQGITCKDTMAGMLKTQGRLSNGEVMACLGATHYQMKKKKWKENRPIGDSPLLGESAGTRILTP